MPRRKAVDTKRLISDYTKKSCVLVPVASQGSPCYDIKMLDKKTSGSRVSHFDLRLFIPAILVKDYNVIVLDESYDIKAVYFAHGQSFNPLSLLF